MFGQMDFRAQSGAHTAPEITVWTILQDAREQQLHWGILLFVVMQPILQWIFKGGRFYTPYRTQWKRVMVVYNLCMSVFSLVTFVLTVYELYSTGVWVDNCDKGSDDFQFCVLHYFEGRML